MRKIKTVRFVIDSNTVGERLDKALSKLVGTTLTRSRIQTLLKQGHIRINGKVCTDASRKAHEGDIAELDLPPPQPANPKAENIPLSILYEDTDIIVLNKPAGLVVHPGAGNPEGTLVNALLHHCAHSPSGGLSGIGGILRPGIVHRLDKDTSGLMVVAKNDAAHQKLAAQLESRSLSRIYKALVLKTPTPPKGTIDLPLGRDHSNRLKRAVNSRNGKEARTHYNVLETYGNACALVECRLESGRTHQIRVHMAALKHPLIGDPLYGPQKTALESALKKAGYDNHTIHSCLAFPRQALHAEKLCLIHPATGKKINFHADLPEDFANLLKELKHLKDPNI